MNIPTEQALQTQEERVMIFAIDRHRIASDGEGVTTLVALRQCPLRCRYCLNEGCHDVPAAVTPSTASDVVERCRVDNLYYLYTGGGICVGGGEPLLHPRFVHELRQRMPQEWRLTLETSLNVPRASVEMIVDDVAQWIIDVKDMNPATYRAYTDCGNERVVGNLRYLADRGLQGRCLVRLPLIAGYNADADRDASEQQLRAMGYERFDRFDYIIKDEKQA